LLYVGLALSSRGLRVVEFNARFGDPETQVVLARLQSPLSALLYGAAVGRLDEIGALRWSGDAAVTVVVAAAGYPESPQTGDVIKGIDVANAQDGAYVLHAGTRRDNHDVVSAGGRVLSVVGTGIDVAQARERAYQAVGQISLSGAQFRSDIAAKAAIGLLADDLER
jgi:phosphoribosylamine--glycine ligase